MRVDLNMFAKMGNPHGKTEYNNLLNIKGEPSLEGADSHQALEPLRAKKAKVFNPRHIWILHLAMVTLYSTVFILIAWMRHGERFHGPSLIFCRSDQSRLQQKKS